jgi:hypothetical protein
MRERIGSGATRVGGGQQMRGKTGRVNPKRSREAHVGRNPSNLTAKLTLGLRLQIFETSWGWIASF